MSIHGLGIPVSLVLHVFEETDAKSMKRVQDRVIVICAILVDKQAARFERLPKLLGVSLRRSSHKGHHNQVPLFPSKSELVIPSDYRLETDAEPLRALSSDSNCLVRGIKARDGPPLGSQEERVPSLS